MNSSQPSFPLRRNIEVKVRMESLDDAQRVAQRLATQHIGRQIQIDTYFRCSDGRLKLREIDGAQAQLIWYARADRAETRQCQYYLLDIPDPKAAKQLLTAALGVFRVVEKRRDIFLHENVRIHLDEVSGLGTFLEFEAVLEPDQDPSDGHPQLHWLCEQFSIDSDQFLSQSYGDMLP